MYIDTCYRVNVMVTRDKQLPDLVCGAWYCDQSTSGSVENTWVHTTLFKNIFLYEKYFLYQTENNFRPSHLRQVPHTALPPTVLVGPENIKMFFNIGLLKTNSQQILAIQFATKLLSQRRPLPLTPTLSLT